MPQSPERVRIDKLRVDKVRVDKWLRAARLYKTRSLAAQAVEGGKARLNGERVKASRDVRAGDTVSVRAGELEWTVSVLALSEQRGPASAAARLYTEGEASRAKRELMLAARKSGPQPLPEAHGRPTKRDRRRLELARRGE